MTTGPHQGWPPPPQPGSPGPPSFPQSGPPGPSGFPQSGPSGFPQSGPSGYPQSGPPGFVPAGPPGYPPPGYPPPGGYPPPPAPGNRNRLWLVLGGIGLAVLLLCGVVTVVAVRSLRDSGAPSATEAGTGSTGRAGGPVTYKVVPDLCVLIDMTPFKEPYPVERDRRPTTLGGGSYTSVSCDIGVSSGKDDFDAGSVRIELDIFGADDAAAGPKRLYEGQQQYAQEKKLATKDVPGLGQAAFSYVEESLGQYLIARADNVWVRANFGVLGDVTVKADDRIARLLKICQDVLPKLKQ